jgi:hypothetical protein
MSSVTLVTFDSDEGKNIQVTPKFRAQAISGWTCPNLRQRVRALNERKANDRRHFGHFLSNPENKFAAR